jgi:molybdenum cofactor cytidylyltransferase|tara:strand:- start:15069 stop:15626 length:558 start_codon:yes stop_codon:yes gene_type:complete
MIVGVLLLAAGSAARFGSDKRVAVMSNNKSIIENTLATIEAIHLPLVVCLKKDDFQLQQQLTEKKIKWVVNENSDKGMGTSIAKGISLCRQWDAIMIVLADMPYVGSKTYRDIAATANRNSIVVPTYDTKKGNPVCFGSSFYQQLEQLNSDKGGKDVVFNNKYAVIEIALNDEGILKDIDKPEDL